MKVVEIKTASNSRNKEVREVLERALKDSDDFQEVFVMARLKDDGRYHWEHSELSEAIWWIGLLNYATHALNVVQGAEDGF